MKSSMSFDLQSTIPQARRTFVQLLLAPLCLCAVVMSIFVLLSTTCSAIPEYSLLTGNRCINCHINAAGGGLRNDLGFYSTEGVSLIKPEWVGMGSVISDVFGSNCAIDRKLFYGLDFRLMSARSSVKPITAEPAERKLFPMQASAQASYHPTSWLFAEAQYNFGRAVYAGQQTWSASINVQPSLASPSLRVGFFQPSIGFNYDDHTELVRQQSGTYPLPIIAPYYSEWGAELRYAAPLWLDVSAGAFMSKNLSDVSTLDSTGAFRSLIQDNTKPLLNARVALTPRLFDEQLNLTIGSSILSSGDFTMINSFGGVGWEDKIAVMFEHMIQGNKDSRQLRAISAEIVGKVIDPIYCYIRAERGTSDNVASGTASNEYLKQYVFGSKIIVFPFIELRPEYRIVDTKEFYRTRWTVQLHVFY